MTGDSRPTERQVTALPVTMPSHTQIFCKSYVLAWILLLLIYSLLQVHEEVLYRGQRGGICITEDNADSRKR